MYKSLVKKASPYAAAMLLSLLALTYVLKLWKIDLMVPLSYHSGSGFIGDTLLASISIKTLLEQGWFTANPDLGAPFGLNFLDFPTTDGFHFLLLKLIGTFFPNFGATINLFYLLTFALTPITALYTLRAFKVSTPVAVVVSILYTFLPYHFLRGLSHLFLAAYYMVPLIVLLALRAWTEPAPFFEHGRFKLSWGAAALFLLCLIVGSTGIYYAFFGCIFIMVATVLRLFSERHLKAMLPGVLICGMIVSGVALNLAPSIAYRAEHGRNTDVASRSPIEAEIYGLKMTQLLLPVGGHRVPLLEKVGRKYDGFPLPNEGSETLGLIGAVGFLSLLLARLHPAKDELSNRLSILNLAGILFATIGGFASLFAMFVSPEIRAQNRISVFIAFFCLFQVALLLDRLRKRYLEGHPIRQHLTYPALGLLLVGGVLDQTGSGFLPNYDGAKQEFANDRAFIQKVEASVPAQTSIFQLPAVPFPENPPVHKMGDYELFRGYLHSRHLKWSYGVMKGRTYWPQRVAAAPPEFLLPSLAQKGFGGVYVDRFGYEDGGKAIEAYLRSELKVQPLVSGNERLAFYSMEKYLAEFQKTHPSEKLTAYWDLLAAMEPSAAPDVRARASLGQFNSLYKAANGYLAKHGDAKDLHPLGLEEKGLLPKYYGGNPPPAGDWNWTVMRGWVGAWEADYAVGVEGTPETITPILDAYGKKAKQVFFPYPQVLSGKPAAGKSGQLLLVFQKPGGAQ